MSELEASIRDLVSRYVAELVAVGDLSDCLPDGWDMDEADESATVELAMRVVGLLADHQAGDLSESELRAELAPIASWTIEGRFSLEDATTRLADSETRVRPGADTRPPVVVGSFQSAISPAKYTE